MGTRTINLDDTLHQYLLEHSLRESDVLRKLREINAREELNRMQIAPEQGQFMALLVEWRATFCWPIQIKKETRGAHVGIVGDVTLHDIKLLDGNRPPFFIHQLRTMETL